MHDRQRVVGDRQIGREPYGPLCTIQRLAILAALGE